ncbi:UNVERIFIED_ORG: hypothetical protein OKW25_004751 [Pseudomonas vranovensis]|nr:hypothetical protein [Pseudomonas vranovensis]
MIDSVGSSASTIPRAPASIAWTTGNGFVQALEHQHFHFSVASESRNHLQRVQHVQKETEKNDIGMQLIGKIQRIGIGGGLAAHFHPRLPGIDQVMKPHENQGTTIDQHHTYRLSVVRHGVPASHEKRSMTCTR